jgi:hypothetical protein
MNNVNGRGIGNIYQFSFAKFIKFTMREIYNRYMELNPLLGVNVHLVDRSDFFKISNLVYGGREYCNESIQQLTGTETVYGGYSELAGSPFVSVKN